jgi:predicted PurR-regulated permease PerM
MKELYNQNKLFFIILIIAVIGYLAWYFSGILICVIVAAVISIIGNPLVELLDKVRIGKIKMPHSLRVILTLLLIITVSFGLFTFFIPLVINEVTLISSIDWNKLVEYYSNEIKWVQNILVQTGFIRKGLTIDMLLKANLTKFLDFSLFSNIVSGVVSFTGTFFFHFFTILFLSFFFLNDITMLPRLLLLLIPEKYGEQTKNVMYRSKILLSRYFIGLIINVLVMIVSYAIALTITGARGALVIAFFGGIVNIIPYIGPFIAIGTGIILGVTGVISAGFYGSIGSMALGILIAMVIVILLDNFVYGPMIQGRSVKAHPVEIFLVIIAAGSLGGIPAMIVAVPGYAFLRIIASEFFSQFRLIQKMKERE